MPFTLAHPAVVLPLVRQRWLDATCLVIGSMSPDFEFFVLAEHRGELSHSWLGVVVWCLPVTLVSAVIFHALISPALLRAAPEWVARRLTGTRWRLSLAAIPSALLGGTTHLLWDDLTHAGQRGGWCLRHYPQIFGYVLELPIVGPTRVVRVLWYGSSLIGLAIVAVYVARAVARRPIVELPPTARTGPRAIFAACIVASVTLLLARAITVLHARDLVTLGVASMSGLIAGVLVASLIVRAAYR